MPAATATQKVNKEAVRLLVIQHGQREAARIAGLNEDTVCSWAKRYGWSIASKPQANGHSALVERVESQLANDERETRASLSRYAKNASREAENMPGVLAILASDKVHNVAKTAAIVHRWDAKSENTQNVVVNVALLGVQPAEVSATVIDVDSEGQDSGT